MKELRKDSTHKLVRIEWDRLNQNLEIEDNSRVEKVEGNLQEALTNPEEFSVEMQRDMVKMIADSVLELQRVLSIDNKKIDIRIRKALIPLASEENMASFRIDETGIYVLEFSGSRLQIHLLHLHLIEEFTEFIAEIGESDPNTVKIYSDLIKKYAEEVAELLITIGHEMYHARQASQHKLYYLRTLAANTISRIVRMGFLKKEEAAERLENDQYGGDKGERSAEAFGIVYLKKKIEKIKIKTRQSILDKTILLGEQVIEEKISELAKRSSESG